MQSQNNNPLLDSKTIVALVLCMGVFYGWNKYMSIKYPNMGKTNTAVISPTGGDAAKATNQPLENGSQATATAGTQDLKSNSLQTEQLTAFDSDNVSFSISNRGMGLKNVVLNKYTDHENNKIKLGDSDSHGLFEMILAHEVNPIYFDIKKTSDNTFVGEANVGSTQIKREIAFNLENYSLTSKTTITKATAETLQGIKFLLPEKITAKASTSFLFPSYEHQDLFVQHETKNDVVNFSSAKENLDKSYSSATVASINSQYFATAMIDKSEISPDVKLTSNLVDKTAVAEITYKPAAIKESIQLDQVFYVGPKSIDILTKVDAELPLIINFGWFGVIATPLLYVMKAFHSVIGNWGLAIILLTLLVRLVVLPFALMSFKSMKAMQKIQPLMAEVRVRYKDDPTRMNQEVMALMKEHKANPVGGCLPMLLQIPVFFALYRVIGSSIELYKSPFFGWITDLSHHDPYYVLPVLMGATMFAQQKLTPTNMDPAQAKIMAFLPLVFSVFMLQLPSGLTLYMFVSGLFGIAQQWFMLQKKA